MIEKIKSYILLGLSILIAVLYFLFLRRGEKLRDLQRESVRKKMDQKLSDLKNNNSSNEKEYEDALKEYLDLRNKYQRLIDAYDSKPGSPEGR